MVQCSDGPGMLAGADCASSVKILAFGDRCVVAATASGDFGERRRGMRITGSARNNENGSAVGAKDKS